MEESQYTQLFNYLTNQTNISHYL